jgi:shikimate kinase
MASGKTTVGRLLADRIGWRFLDLDSLVRDRTGLGAGELIRRRGEPVLRATEAAITAELANRSGVVLATGGGWATRPELAAGLGAGTVRVWLRVSAAEAVRRAIADDVDRPLLGDRSRAGEWLARAGSLLGEREPYYAEAEIAVDVDGRSPAEIVGEIVGRLDAMREDDER